MNFIKYIAEYVLQLIVLIVFSYIIYLFVNNISLTINHEMMIVQMSYVNTLAFTTIIYVCYYMILSLNKIMTLFDDNE